MPEQPLLPLSRDLPPDGTYPPRIVAPGVSLWLHEDRPTAVINPGVFAQRYGSKCYLFEGENAGKKEVTVNGQLLIGRRVLKDGDFIVCGSARAIFQADPVADFRAELQREAAENPNKPIDPTPRLKQYVIVNDVGVSLDGGNRTARWGEIHSLEISWEASSNTYGARVAVLRDKRVEYLKSRFRTAILSSEEMTALYHWLMNFAPFQLSVSDFQRIWPDAYSTIAYRKVVEPADNRRKILPASREFVLDAPTRNQVLRQIGCSLLLAALVSFVFFSIADGDPRVFVGSFLIIVILNNGKLRKRVRYIRQLSDYDSWST